MHSSLSLYPTLVDWSGLEWSDDRKVVRTELNQTEVHSNLNFMFAPKKQQLLLTSKIDIKKVQTFRESSLKVVFVRIEEATGTIAFMKGGVTGQNSDSSLQTVIIDE